MAVTPYRGPERTTRDEIDIDIRRGAPRPGIMRRQSSLDTFDRRPVPRYEREEIRIPAYTPVPLPIPRDDGFGDYQRGRYNEPEEYREVEIRRERSVRRTGGGPKSHKSSKSSKAKSVSTRRSSSSSSSSSNTTIQEVKSRHSRSHRAPSMHESYHEDIHTPGGLSIHESFHESVHGGASSVSDSITQIEKKFKKGKTRMPKRLVRREAIMDLGYPFDEEDDFFVLRIALEKEQIDEVMKISESYKTEGKSVPSISASCHSNSHLEKKIVYKYEESPALLAPPQEHEEVIRTEWINPPTVAGSRVARSEYQGRRDSSPSGASTTTRRTSPARTARSRRTSHSRHQSQPPPPEFYEQRKTVIEERVPSNAGPPPPPPMAPMYYEERKAVVEERGSPSSHYHQPSHNSHSGALIIQERDTRSDRDIQSEIARLEAERRALRLERDAEDKRNMALRIRENRTEEDYQLVEYREPRQTREVVDVYERDKSPPRNVLRVEKDRKGRMALVRSTH